MTHEVTRQMTRQVTRGFAIAIVLLAVLLHAAVATTAAISGDALDADLSDGARAEGPPVLPPDPAGYDRRCRKNDAPGVSR